MNIQLFCDEFEEFKSLFESEFLFVVDPFWVLSPSFSSSLAPLEWFDESSVPILAFLSVVGSLDNSCLPFVLFAFSCVSECWPWLEVNEPSLFGVDCIIGVCSLDNWGLLLLFESETKNFFFFGIWKRRIKQSVVESRKKCKIFRIIEFCTGKSKAGERMRIGARRVKMKTMAKAMWLILLTAKSKNSHFIWLR